MSLIETEALVRRYGRVVALDGLTLEVEPGIIGLVGPNGAGKSTLIKILLGLIAPTSGRAEVLGLDATREGLRIRERVGYMPEHDCLPGDQSATDFVIHMARMSGIPPAHARERTAETLRHVGLYEERYRQIKGYSTGMKQRVKLAQALVHDPRLLFLDEPTNGLDPQGRDEMLDLVARTGHSFGASIVMSSHLLGEIERVCDSLVIIESGRLLQAGPVATFTNLMDALTVEVEWGAEALADRLTKRGLSARAERRTVHVAVGESTPRVNDVVVSTVAELELPLIRLTRQRRSLEELFSTDAGAAEAGEPIDVA